jgi:hypothetical protein
MSFSCSTVIVSEPGAPPIAILLKIGASAAAGVAIIPATPKAHAAGASCFLMKAREEPRIERPMDKRRPGGCGLCLGLVIDITGTPFLHLVWKLSLP